MSLYPETTNAVSVSPRRHEEEDESKYTDEEDEYKEEEEQEESEDESEEEEEEGEEEEESDEEEESEEEEEESEDESDEEEEESEDESDEEEDEEGDEEEEEEQQTTPTANKARKLLVRFAIMLCWLVAFHLASSTIVTGITCLIVNSVKCFGGIIGLAIFVLPAAYAISPERVCNFKFQSLAPTIADGLYKLDCLVKRVMCAVSDRLGDNKLKIKQV
jgi:hypothetical protein